MQIKQLLGLYLRLARELDIACSAEPKNQCFVERLAFEREAALRSIEALDNCVGQWQDTETLVCQTAG